MDYLRTLGSAAVSSLVQKSGLNLPFSLGSKIASFDGLWNLYDGTKRDDGTAVSVFEYDFSDPSKRNSIPLAKNALRRLRTTRHPDVLKFMDAVETETTVYIMTERVRPLPATLATWASRGAQEREDWLLWGLHRISVALAFVNDSCISTHGNIRVNSIFISPSGEWKLGAFELFSSPRDDTAILYTLGGMIPDASLWSSPEVKKGGWSVLKQYDPAAADAYALGLLLHAVFNPSHPPPPTIEPPHSPPSPSSRGSIPNSVFPSFKKLLNPNPKARLSPKGFLDIGTTETGFFSTNRLVKVCAGLDNFSLGTEADKSNLLRTLKDSATSFPPEFASYRILPSLVSALEFGGASAAAILPLVLQFGKNIPPEEYPGVILAPLIKLFASPDRGTRMALLDQLPIFADKLDKKMVSEKIWPNLQTGFLDTVAVIREATVKSIILISAKLTDRILNNDLLRHLAKMQMDPEPSIRTNSCILIGRLGPSLGYNTKRKVLVPAFSRALKDPFVHARVAGLMALMATIDCFEIEELASKVIPNMSYTLLDQEKLVRDQAFKAMDLFVKKLEAHAAAMPETAITETDAIPGSMPVVNQATIVNSAAGAAGALAGWAISSLGKTLVSADLQSTIGAIGVATGRPTSAPPPPGGFPLQSSSSSNGLNPLLSGPSTLSMAQTLSSPSVTTTRSLQPSSSKAKGMQLGAHKASVNPALPAELADEVADGNLWGTDDLIDINADDDDWSAFESAPSVPSIVEPQPVSAIGPGFGNGNGSTFAQHSGDPWNTAHQSASNGLSHHSQARKPATPVRTSISSTSNRHASLALSPTPADTDSWDTPERKISSTPQSTPSMANMTKEEKAAEMNRRKEERKQRIAQLKEHKKNAAKT